MAYTSLVTSIAFIPITVAQEIVPGDDLAQLLWDNTPTPLEQGDIAVVTHKAVSKAEGHIIDLRTIEPSAFAIRFARSYSKDARLVELVLRQSASIVRMRDGLIISRTPHGFTCANAGIDISNSAPDMAIVLPPDPDASAQRLSAALSQRSGFDVPVIICDSFGRPWRQGIVNVTIGLAGMSPFTDYRGQRDPAGYELKASLMASADAIAAGAELAMGKLRRTPLALARGIEWQPPAHEANAKALLFPPERDFFP